MLVAIGDEGDMLPPHLLSSITPTVGSVIQGMLRVFRREMGLDEVMWALDLPPMNSIEYWVLFPARFIHASMDCPPTEPSHIETMDGPKVLVALFPCWKI